MVTPALLTGPSPLGTSDAPTYGGLIGSTAAMVDEACVHGSGPFPDARHATSAAINYERFLAVAGRHLRLLATPGQAQLDGHLDALPPLHQLVQRMARLDLDRADDDAWSRAASSLAAAHDLLSTHVGPAGERHTADANILDDRQVRDAAAGRLLELITTPIERCATLLSHAYDVKHQTPGPAVTRARSAHLRQTVDAAQRLTTRAKAGLQRPMDDDRLTSLDELTPALTRTTDRPPEASFDTARGALRVLRMLSHRQSLGEENASPACLHDLARLAITTSRAAEGWMPEPTTPLARVRNAVALDELHDAGRAWQGAADALGQHVRGLTKAPRLYADAVGTAIDQAPHSTSLGLAVLSALPRLGSDASSTITHLAESNSLAVATKEVGRFQANWRMLTPTDAETLAQRFEAAGRASQRAHTTYLQTQAGPRSSTESQPQRQQARRRELTAAGVSR